MKVIDKIRSAFLMNLFHRSLLTTSLNAQDNFSLNLLQPLMPANRYVPVTGYTMNPTMIAHILNDILILGRRNIVEFGSGLSTLFILRLIKHHELTGIRLTSFDHDNEWQAILKRALELEGVEFTDDTFICASLKDQSHGEWQGGWYDLEAVEGNITDGIDTVIVDGPPVFEGTRCRFPALPVIRKRMAREYSVFLDDTYRKDEYQIVKMWQEILRRQPDDYKQYTVFTSNKTIKTAPFPGSYERKYKAMVERGLTR